MSGPTPAYSFNTWQIALVGIAFVSICVLVQSVRRWSMTDGLLALTISVLSLVLLYSTLMIQGYAGLTSTVLVAHIKAATVTSSASGSTLSVEITLYQNGQPTSDETYRIPGNEWRLQGDSITVSGLLGMVGLHSGYKITRLEGRYTDAHAEAAATHMAVTLNGGDDGFFQAARLLKSFVSPFIAATDGNAVVNGTGSYNIYISQSGLWAKGV